MRFFVSLRMTLTGEFMRGPHRHPNNNSASAESAVRIQSVVNVRVSTVAGAQRCEKLKTMPFAFSIILCAFKSNS